MNHPNENILKAFRKRWQWLECMRILLLAAGPAILLYFFRPSLAIVVFVAIWLLLFLWSKPWRLSLNRISSFIDRNLLNAENSTSLLLQPADGLSNLARLQRVKVLKTLHADLKTIKPNVALKPAIFVFIFFVLLTSIAVTNNWTDYLGSSNKGTQKEDIISFQPLDSTEVKDATPVLENQRLTITYPSYTNLAPRNTTKMDVKALEGSTLTWYISFDSEIDSAMVQEQNAFLPMKKKEGGYITNTVVDESSFYNFRFVDVKARVYQSDLYALEMVRDQQPNITIEGIEQFTAFEETDAKVLDFETLVTDDYGLSEVFIIATVSKGEGESVKFREERLSFDSNLIEGTKSQRLTKKLNLDALKMEPGDELYFYVSAVDSKSPKSNIARSETYFASIRDTITNQFSVEGTMGADLMPAYFRSQRQLIIDTEKLIADRPNITKKDHDFTSNELGFDQKSLRLKYGQFMGDEAESGIQVSEAIPTEEITENNDPLADYSHNHDSENEHNLVGHSHEEEKGTTDEEDPLEKYLHNHDDPEESTLFTESLKGKLREAMNEMWDAELYLRMYTPEKSLPYQYRALKLIQEIKNSSRIYVHRIGFDPPPIKEEKRLTGKLDDINSFTKKENFEVADSYANLRKSVAILENSLQANEIITKEDQMVFANAGNELGTLAIRNPGKYLKTLQRLRSLADGKEFTTADLKEIQAGLLKAIPKLKSNPSYLDGHKSHMNSLFLEELSKDD